MNNIIDGIMLLAFDRNLTLFIDAIIAQFETVVVFVTVQ